jgi:hypothetical protein
MSLSLLLFLSCFFLLLTLQWLSSCIILILSVFFREVWSHWLRRFLRLLLHFKKLAFRNISIYSTTSISLVSCNFKIWKNCVHFNKWRRYVWSSLNCCLLSAQSFQEPKIKAHDHLLAQPCKLVQAWEPRAQEGILTLQNTSVLSCVMLNKILHYLDLWSSCLSLMWHCLPPRTLARSRWNHMSKAPKGRVWWCTSVISALGVRLRQEGHEFQTSLGYIIRPCLIKSK